MRTIHADLITAQQSGSADPYIYLGIDSVNYADRLISYEWIENPYRDLATIVLANSDHYFDANNLRGKSFSIGTGYVTTSGNRYCGDGTSDANPTLWVKSQSLVSMEGKLVCLLECEGGWMKLREYHFITTASGQDSDAPHFNIKFKATDTVFELIEKALVEAGFTLNAIGDQSDGIIDEFHPIFVANPLTFDTPASIIKRLIYMTKCYVRAVEGGAFEIVYPQSSDSVNETYYSNTAPYFREYVEKMNLLIPNSIAVFCNIDPSGDWNTADYPLITGTAEDAASIADYEEVTDYHVAFYIDNQDDADNRAAAILTRYKAEVMAGRLLLPFHDCRVELYDRIGVYDSR